MTSVVEPKCYKATKILFVHKENKNNDFIHQFVSSASPYSTILKSNTYVKKTYILGYVVYIQIRTAFVVNVCNTFQDGAIGDLEETNC